MASLHSLSSYLYELPESLIAQQPVHPRDASRLLVVHRKEGRWEHRQFRDLPEYLTADDLMVLNNTRVLKARLLGRRKIPGRIGEESLGGRVEFVLLEDRAADFGNPNVWEGLFHASAKSLPGFEFVVPTPEGQTLVGKVIRSASESPVGTVIVEFNRDPVQSGAGELPLPHYMNRKAVVADEESYQTVYSKELGSAAAPTAGLHFTADILNKIKSKGIKTEEVTLHVGLGTFRPVKAQDVREHRMHEERYFITDQTAESVTCWKNEGRRILAVGTTSVRTLESAWNPELKMLQSGEQRTSIFIYPGSHSFQVVDRLLTNFHLPGSTLLMLVSAFAGRELILAAYEDAVQQKYRFFSYGDAMLVL